MITKEETIKLYESLRPGDRLKYFYQKGNINNRTLHVRGRVDNVLIVRRRIRKKRTYVYETMEYWAFQVPLEYGSMKVIRSKSIAQEEDWSGKP